MAKKCYEGHRIMQVAESRRGFDKVVQSIHGFACKEASQPTIQRVCGSYRSSLGRSEVGLAGQVEVSTS